MKIGYKEVGFFYIKWWKPFNISIELASKRLNWFFYVSIISMRMGVDQRDWVGKQNGDKA